MCGIIGYIGDSSITTNSSESNTNTKDILIKGLQKLEYRGYDSAGIAILNENINIFKAKGKIKNLEETIQESINSNANITAGNIGIGHTRWATHGEPNKTNCHPHFSNDNKIAVVHNGIIENYIILKEDLIKQGYKFITETDTEVIVHLFDSFYKGNMLEALNGVVGKLEGSYALCVICQDEPDKILVTRKDSPLIIGIGQNENFIASDIPAILEHTKEYYLLDDLETAIITSQSVQIFDSNKKELKKEIFKVDWDISLAEKSGYDYFMLKEIMEQPECIKKCIGSYIHNNSIDFEYTTLKDEEIKNINRIHIIACGSAYNAGMVGKSLIEKMCRIPVNLEIASEFRYQDPILHKDDICIIISQSGETADTLAALREAKSKGIKTISIVNVVGSSIARESDNVIYTLAGPEIAVATTKGYSTQMIILYLLAVKFANIRGNITQDKFNSYLEELGKIPEQIAGLVDMEKHEIYKNIANKYSDVNEAFMIGRGIDYGICLEAVLKLKEISYVHSEAYQAGELKHGSIALIEDGSVVFGILTQDELYEKTISNLKEVKSRGAKIIVVSKESYKEKNLEEFADDVVYVNDIAPEFIPSTVAVPMQLIAYYVAINRECDIDMPRNLAKSVTVE